MSYARMTVQYQESSRRWFAWVERDYFSHLENCCSKGHKSLTLAARHGSRRVELWATAEWINAALIPGTWAYEVLGPEVAGGGGP